jgi:pimeloyl-ACP methyl ester carboxylesterase
VAPGFRLPYRDETRAGLPLRRFYFPDGLVDPARAVVCVPGLAASGRSFARLAPLAARFDLRLVTAPLREPLPGSPIAALARCVGAYVSELSRPVLFGTSFGSLVALEVALASPGRLAGLVLCSAIASGAMIPQLYAAFAGALLAPRPVGWIAAPLAARVLGGGALDREARGELVRQARLVSPAEMFRRVNALLGTDLTAALPLLEVPVLVVHGTRDLIVPVKAARRMARALPAWRYREIPGAGHVPYLSHPRQFLGVVEPFLDEALPAG